MTISISYFNDFRYTKVNKFMITTNDFHHGAMYDNLDSSSSCGVHNEVGGYDTESTRYKDK